MVLVDISLIMVMLEWFIKFLFVIFEGGYKILFIVIVFNFIEGYRFNGEVFWFCDNIYVFFGLVVYCVIIILY